VLEEICKLMTCGKAGVALERLVDYGLLQRLLPEIGPYWAEHRHTLRALGDALDIVDRGRRVVSNGFLLAVLWERPWRAALSSLPPDAPPAQAAEALHALLDPAALRMSIPRRDVTGIRHAFQALSRMERGRRGRLNDFLSRASTHDAVQLMHLLARADCLDPELHADWAMLIADTGPARPAEDEEPRASAGRGGRRRGRRGGRRRGGRGRHARRDGHGDGDGEGGRRAASQGEASPADDSVAEAGAEAAQTGAGRPGDGGSMRKRSSRRRGRRRRKSAQGQSGADAASGDRPDTAEAAAEAAPGKGRDTAPASRDSISAEPSRRRRSRGSSRRRRGRERSDGEAPAGEGRRTETPAKGPRPSPLREHPEDVEDLFDW
jgi:hypothetical protein